MPTIQETIEKAREFERLPRGRHFGDGIAPPVDRIEQVIRLIRRASLLGLRRANAFPGVNGQIEVTFYDDDRMLEITIEDDDSLTVAENKGNAQVGLSERLSPSQVYERLNVWASSDLFIESTTIRSVRVSLPKHSIFEPVNQFQWLTTTAPLPRAGQFVGISSAITMSRVEFQPSIGPFQITYFPPTFALNWNEAQPAMNAIVTSIGDEEMPVESLAA